MGRKKKLPPIERPEYPTDVLEKLDLDLDEQVRFKQPGTKVWRYAEVKGQGFDGSLTLWDDMGNMRSIVPEICQRKTRGPKGGVKWVPLT